MAENRLAADLDHVLEHTRDLWEALRGERIFITGGTGFFGCWLLESFAWANRRLSLGARAVVLSRSPEILAAKAPHLAGEAAVVLVKGDIRTFPFPDGDFRFVIHAAMETNTRLTNPDPLAYFDSGVLGTRRVLGFARANQPCKLLFTSSGAVYGRQPADLSHLDEEYPGAPLTGETRFAYGQAKRAAEFLCTAYSEVSGIEVKICRGFAFSGPYLPLDAGFAIGNFLRDALSGGPVRVSGDGSPYRSYLYAADLAIWLWTILFRGENRRAYNVGSENALSIADLAKMVRDTVQPACRIEIARQPVADKPAERYVPSTRRARQELGLQEWIGPEEGIRRMAKWYMERSGD